MTTISPKIPLLLCFVLLLHACSNAKKPTWFEIGKSETTTIYMSTLIQGVENNKRFVAANTLWDFKTPQQRDTGETFMSATQLFLVDCDANKVASMRYEHYSDSMGAGKVIASDWRDFDVASKELAETTHPAIQAIADSTCEKRRSL